MINKRSVLDEFDEFDDILKDEKPKIKTTKRVESHLKNAPVQSGVEDEDMKEIESMMLEQPVRKD